MYKEHTSTLLQITSSTIENFTRSRQDNGDYFNIFSILDMERKEVGTHSKFIYELLNPQGCHYQYAKFANLFLKMVLKLSDAGEVKKVRREDLTENGRRIDFTISTENYLIGIEMKIDAKDQRKQLYDYNKEIVRRVTNTNQRAILFYLTLDGSLPSKHSTKTLDIERIHCISFSQDILKWLEACIKIVALNPVIRELIQQYYLIIKKITHKNTELSMKIVEEITKNKNNLLAAEKIHNEYFLAIKRIENNFVESLIESVQNLSAWSPDKGSKNSNDIINREEGWIWIPYKIGILKQDASRCIYASISQASNHDYLRLAVFIGSTSEPEKTPIQLDESLKNEITKNLLDKLAIYSIKENYAWGDLVNGCIDNDFKLNGADNLIKWMGVTSSSEEVITIAKIAIDALDKVKYAVSIHVV